MGIPHKTIPRVEYTPVSVRDILTTMKSISELMIDLAYSALLFSSKELGEWVMELESEVDRLGYLLFMTLSLSVRGKTDAELSVGLFRVCTSANRISDAAADIASLAVTGQEIHSTIKAALQRSEERLVTARVGDGSEIADLSISDINDKFGIAVDVTAVRRDGTWVVNPPSDFVVRAGDALFFRGAIGGTARLYELSTGERPLKPAAVEESLTETVRLFLDMKETSEFMVSLAYAAVYNDSKELAEEVAEQEDRMDKLHEVLGKETLIMGGDALHRWTMIRVANALESIADAAWEMAMVPLSGLETHPVIQAIAHEAEEIVTLIDVRADSPLANHTLEELALEDKYGVYVQSVKRAGHWFHRPTREFRLAEGDVLVLDGYRDGMHSIRADLGLE
ncbi:MAG: potassium channel family protein [Candidatus Thorarchaeota archaeon]